MKKYFSKIFLTSTVIILGMVSCAYANTSLTITGADTQSGIVSLTPEITTDTLVNAAEGVLVFPQDKLTFIGISTEDTPVSLWVDSPHLTPEGIAFSGMIPGGFQGSGNLFKAYFQVKQQGVLTADFKNIQVFAHDGEGTLVTARVIPFSQMITREYTSSESVSLFQDDHISPEPFTINRSRDVSLFNNKWFLSYVTQDKQSRIEKYRVCEYGFFCSDTVSNSYELRFQNPLYIIKITAFDANNNTRKSTLISPWIGIISGIVGLSFLIYFSILFYRKNKKKSLQ